MENNSSNTWVKAVRLILDALQTPLSLIAFICFLDIYCLSKLLPLKKEDAVQTNTIAVVILISVFGALVIVVSVLCIWKPENLIYDKEAKLRDKNKPPFGTSEHPVSVKNLSKKNVKPNNNAE